MTEEINLRILLEIINLKTLNNIKKELPRYENWYRNVNKKNLNTDFALIQVVIENELPYDVIEFFLKRFYKPEKIKELLNENINVLVYCKYLSKEKFDELDLLFRYGFDVNTIYQDEGQKMNAYFMITRFEDFRLPTNGRMKILKFLVEHNIDVHFSNKFFAPKQFILSGNPLSYGNSYDTTIVQYVDPRKENNRPQSIYKALEYIFKYFNRLRLKTVLELLYRGHDHDQISQPNFNKVLQNFQKYPDANTLHSSTLSQLVMFHEKKDNIMELFIHYYGWDEFYETQFEKFVDVANESDPPDTEFIGLIFDFQKEKELFQKIAENNYEELEEADNSKWLTRNINDIKDRVYGRPLLYAIKRSRDISYKRMIDLFIRCKADKEIIDDYQCNALHFASRYNRPFLINKFITNRNINAKNKEGDTPFMVALKYHNLECARKLLKNESFPVKVNLYNNNLKTALDIMIDHHLEDYEIIDLLFKKGAYINEMYLRKNPLTRLITNNDALIQYISKNQLVVEGKDQILHIHTPLLYLTKIDKTELVEKLLDYRMKNKKLKDKGIEEEEEEEESDEEGFTPIFYTIKNNNVRLFNKFLDCYPVNLTKTNHKNETPLDYARKQKNKLDSAILKELISKTKKMEEEKTQREKRKKEKGKNVVDDDDDENDDENENSVNENHERLMEDHILSNHFWNNDNKSNMGSYIPYTFRTEEDKGQSSHNSANEDDDIPTLSENEIFKYPEQHVACYQMENEEELEMILDMYDVNESSVDGSTPLLFSLKYGKDKSARVLLKKENINVLKSDHQNENPLTFLLKHPSSKNKSLLNDLLSILKFTDKKLSPEHLTALQYLINHGHWPSLQKLCQNGNLNINYENEEGDTLLLQVILHYVIQPFTEKKYESRESIEEFIEWLLKQGANPNKENHSNANPLIYAIENEELKLIDILVRNNADINYKINQSYKTPAKVAIYRNNIEVCRALYKKKLKEKQKKAKGKKK